jgi:hypothetical protein
MSQLERIYKIDLSVANSKISLNSGIFGDFDTKPARATSSSFSFIRLSPSFDRVRIWRSVFAPRLRSRRDIAPNRIDGGIGMGGNVFDVHQRVRAVARACKEVREGVGEKGDWSIDFHQKFDFPDALRLCRSIEEYEPYLVEDPTRDEQFLEDIPKL